MCHLQEDVCSVSAEGMPWSTSRLEHSRCVFCEHQADPWVSELLTALAALPLLRHMR